MEEEAKLFLNETEYGFQKTAGEVVLDITSMVAQCLAFSCDLAIVYMIAWNAHMKSRTNLLLMHWAINDALFLFTSPSLIGMLLYKFVDVTEYRWLYCTTLYCDTLFQMNAAIMLTLMMSTTVMKMREVSGFIIAMFFYGFILCTIMIEIIFCSFRIYFTVLAFPLFANTICMIVMLVFKEINNCWKRSRDPLSEDTVFRLNLARIYYYTWTISLLILPFYYTAYRYNLQLIVSVIALLGYMNGIYILAYIVNADRKFKICFYDLIRRHRGNYDADTTVNFAEQCDEFDQDAAYNVSLEKGTDESDSNA